MRKPPTWPDILSLSLISRPFRASSFSPSPARRFFIPSPPNPRHSPLSHHIPPSSPILTPPAPPHWKTSFLEISRNEGAVILAHELFGPLCALNFLSGRTVIRAAIAQDLKANWCANKTCHDWRLAGGATLAGTGSATFAQEARLRVEPGGVLEGGEDGRGTLTLSRATLEAGAVVACRGGRVAFGGLRARGAVVLRLAGAKPGTLLTWERLDGPAPDFRAEGLPPGRARFRTYQGRVVHSVACDRLRRIRAHGAEVAVPPEACELLLAPDLPIDERLDIQFRFAAYEAVLRELLRDPGLSPLQRTVLESCFLRRERPADLARRLRRLPNTITQIKKRLSKRLQARVDALCED